MIKSRTLPLIVAVCWLLSMAPAAQSHSNEPTKFDGRRLKTGSFEYQDFKGRQGLGKSQIVIETVSGSDTIKFSANVTGNFSQRWLAIVRSNFEPISAKLTFGDSPAFEISYNSGRVSGVVVERKGPNAGTKHIVDDLVASSVIDQRVDWAAVSASDFGADPKFEFDVYDPGIGTSHVFAGRGPLQSLRVPAGEFQVYAITYEITKRSGPEIYKVFVTKDQPRFLVRENFPDGTESDLIAIHSGQP